MPVEKKKYDYIRKSFVSDGKQYVVTGKTEQEVAEKLALKKEAVRRAELTTGANYTVEKWAETWLETYIKPKVRQPGAPKKKGTMTQKSYRMYESKVYDCIIPALKGKKMRSVTDTMLQNVMNRYANISESQAQKLRIVLRSMFSQAAYSRVIPYDPSVRITLPAAKPTKKRRSLTPEEQEALLKVAETHRCGLWVRFLMRTGLRPGESAALRVEHLDMENKLIHVCQSVEAGTKVISTPKTEAGDRFVPIPEDIYADLEKHISTKGKSDFVFTQTDGKSMMTEASMKKGWCSFARQMDLAMGAETAPNGHIYDPDDVDENGDPLYPDENGEPRNGHKISPDLVLYCLRHTYCTNLQKAGVPINVAKALMGHSSIAVTANVYTDATVDDALSALKRINETIKPTVKK